jgi:hypothetical protein
MQVYDDYISRRFTSSFHPSSYFLFFPHNKDFACFFIHPVLVLGVCMIISFHTAIDLFPSSFLSTAFDSHLVHPLLKPYNVHVINNEKIFNVGSKLIVNNNNNNNNNNINNDYNSIYDSNRIKEKRHVHTSFPFASYICSIHYLLSCLQMPLSSPSVSFYSDKKNDMKELSARTGGLLRPSSFPSSPLSSSLSFSSSHPACEEAPPLSSSLFLKEPDLDNNRDEPSLLSPSSSPSLVLLSSSLLSSPSFVLPSSSSSSSPSFI